ncbi:MAG: hypothetical protein N2490_07365 [Ignavibacteria bacterium]|nr:hypothetical protein [Ignavibacteria bacterium]
MKNISNLYLILLIFFITIISQGCNKENNKDVTFEPPKEYSSDKERELSVKEEMLNQRQKELDERERNLNIKDSILTARELALNQGKIDTTSKTDLTKKDIKEKKNIEKEKELNKRLDNPKNTIQDYLEYIKRAVEGGNFDENIKKASDQWEGRSVESFKKSYKNVKKFSRLEEPVVLSQKGNTAKVKVKVKQVEVKDNKEVESTLTVIYNLVADKNGKWKIKGNIIDKK